MCVDDLKQFGLKLKRELQKEGSPETVKKVALEIKKATYTNGTPLTTEEKEHVIKYIALQTYDHKTGIAGLSEADNAEFLKLVALVTKNVKGDK